ncbi:hypothetical protein CEJ39_13700 [Rhodococcus pyridinivorans]|uniref:hypothetical protein n=1 Tax=Rhodococcus pyridinivorans TaxID=103816 RepID=UPI000571D3B3|nr:hypothetical protein [Rhodococcus pyridinivorans]AWZ25100.1 hypothetical protein CEJ39_13700 [Rhodococcus pyridinivorans]MCD5418077.1 hypothetical protein [Rhodococcus pyridinivorans]
MTLHVDYVALQSITSICSAAGNRVDEAGESVPVAVDAGDATAAVLGIISLLMENAADLVMALASTSEAVAQSNTAYRTGDDELALELISVRTE